MNAIKQCPGCGHAMLSAPWTIPQQPVVLNYRFATPSDAWRVPRRDLRLVQCLGCGLIFNGSPDGTAIPYDANYENRQGFSPAFQKHLGTMADDLIKRYSLRNGRILEVGCGKGEFLKLICARANASGVGYDTSYDGPATQRRRTLRFHKHYVTARIVRKPYDAIICRHVVEHVGRIGEFLAGLRAIATAAGDAVTVIETPAFEWIDRHSCFWDIFHEHCNYFTMPCLAYLCERAGFIVARQRSVFEGQYQVLELKVSRTARSQRRPPGPTVHLQSFARRADAALDRLKKRLRLHGAAGGWAIWGAGAKGVALVNSLREPPPNFVIDSNPAKHGCFIPGSRVPVVAPEDPRIRRLALVLIANPNYLAEISLVLRQGGFDSTILTA